MSATVTGGIPAINPGDSIILTMAGSREPFEFPPWEPGTPFRPALGPATTFTNADGRPVTIGVTANVNFFSPPTGTWEIQVLINGFAFGGARCSGAPSDTLCISCPCPGTPLEVPWTNCSPAVGGAGWAISLRVTNNTNIVIGGIGSSANMSLDHIHNCATWPQIGNTTLTTAASTPTGGGVVHDVATFSHTSSASGFIVFKLWDNPSCSGSPIFMDSVAVAGNGVYTCADFTLPLPGTYYWTAEYLGDNWNLDLITACGDVSETITWTTSTATMPIMVCLVGAT